MLNSLILDEYLRVDISTLFVARTTMGSTALMCKQRPDTWSRYVGSVQWGVKGAAHFVGLTFTSRLPICFSANKITRLASFLSSFSLQYFQT